MPGDRAVGRSVHGHDVGGAAPGEVRLQSAPAQTVVSAAGDPTVSAAIDPIAGQGACATTSAADEPGTANYRLPAATGDGYTLLGSPTVIATLKVSGTFPALAERLWDVGPDGRQTLVARGLYRPSGDGRVVFQLHPGAWHFAAGHVPKLQLLARDTPYSRASNGTFTIAVRASICGCRCTTRRAGRCRSRPRRCCRRGRRRRRSARPSTFWLTISATCRNVQPHG